MLLTDNLNVIYLELPKVPDPKTLSESAFNALQSYEKWSIFLLHVDNPEYKLFVDKVAATQQEVRMAEKEIYRMSLRERFWRWQVSRENAREDAYVFKETRKRLLAETKTSGLAEGRAAGLTEGRAAAVLETARNMKKVCIADETIAQCTGLTLAEIKEL